MKTAFGNIEMLLEAEVDEGRALSRAERRELQVQRILEAAKTCFAREGFQGASMQQICAEASMSPGALYRYFVSKEAIIEEICAAARRDDEEKLAEMLTKRDAIEGMVFGSMTHIRFVHETDACALIDQKHPEMRLGNVDTKKMERRALQILHVEDATERHDQGADGA